jgi:hypothetical protein
VKIKPQWVVTPGKQTTAIQSILVFGSAPVFRTFLVITLKGA